MENCFCKIFICTSLGKQQLFDKILSLLKGEKESFSDIRSPWCDAHLAENSYYSPNSDPNDFIYFPYYLEIYENKTNDTEYINNIREIIFVMNSIGYKAVAACDFEDMLD
ncbi:MAG: hypothetical protein IJ446_05010 [Oscillospiraceae bacterium]|nr:hypothetical protein [Oscillospiraceae bacterium]